MVPSNCAVKVTGDGETIKGTTPVPFNVTVWVPTASVMVRVPCGTAPGAFGVNVRPIAQVAPEASEDEPEYVHSG